MTNLSISEIVKSNIFLAYAIVPLLAMFLSFYTQVGSDVSVLNIRPNACGELFSFNLALDAALLMSKQSVITRVNPLLAANFDNWLVVLLLLSVVLMVYSGRTQCRIRNRPRSISYPYIAVAICWVFGVAFTATHLYLLLGTKK